MGIGLQPGIACPKQYSITIIYIAFTFYELLSNVEMITGGRAQVICEYYAIFY